MHTSTVKKSLALANLAKFDMQQGYKFNIKKVLTNYNLFSSICRGDIKVKEVATNPTPNVEKLADQYEKIPKNGFIFFKDVKRAYPEIAETLKKEIFQNKDRISVPEIIKMIEEIEPEDNFWISFDKWEGMQKDLSHSQVVVQLNMDQKLIKEIEENPVILKFIEKFYEMLKQTPENLKHPAHGQTIAWCRIYKFPDKWIIEEIQSDLLGADAKASDKIDKIISEFNQAEMTAIGNFLAKHFIDWDKKLVGSVIEMARNEQVTAIWIFDDDYKKRYTDSKSKLKRYYKEVPRDLGFKRDTLHIGNKTIPAWKRPVAKLKAIKIAKAAMRTYVDLPIPTIKDLLTFIYKTILKDLGRLDMKTWMVFNLALNHMSDEEIKQEWKAITDGTVSEIVQNLMQGGETKDNLMHVFDNMTKKYFEENMGTDKEKLEKAHTQIREYLKMLKQKPVLH